MTTMPGCVLGTVVENVDPKRNGRIRVHIPALGEPYVSQWLIPAGYPGSGLGVRSGGFGSKYPVAKGAMVFVIFELGDPYGEGIWFFGGYGYKDGTVDSVTTDREAAGDPAVNYRATLWEDPYIRVFVEFDSKGYGNDNRKITIEDKNRATLIELNTDDAGKGASTITITAASGLSIYSGGTVDISGGAVQIQGRRVMPYGKRPI